LDHHYLGKNLVFILLPMRETHLLEDIKSPEERMMFHQATEKTAPG
jgi:hypothetical protein